MGGAPLAAAAWRFEEDFSDGRVLGGVADPGAVSSVEEDLLDGSWTDESLERLLCDERSVLKLPLDKRRRSCRNEGMPV